jgi:5-methylcytosine-specific restriction endonuclease McrA
MARRHSAEYEATLESERWREVRLEALKQAGFQCSRCGTRQGPLDAHHWRGYSMLGQEAPQDLMILCRRCHDQVHAPGATETGCLKAVFWIVVMALVLQALMTIAMHVLGH